MRFKKPEATGLILAGAAAFCTYFCMYAFRKPFTAGTFEGREVFGFGLKSALVVSQLIGYMLSKVLGIGVVSGRARERRGLTIIGLIVFAEAALVGFSWASPPWQVAFMFLNGLPLGMVFGLVVSYLEGRRQTEALAAALTASFIVSSGVVKSIGRWLIVDMGVDESRMPMLVGLLFFPALLASVWMLSLTPPPDEDDLRERRQRPTMGPEERRRFLAAYGPGLGLLVLVYAVLTIIRTIRDDYGVEIWRELGSDHAPSIFARTETLVAVVATVVNASAFMIRDNLTAFRSTLTLTAASFGLVAASTFALGAGAVSPFGFMAACGLGLYLPYTAFHTTIFERLIAAAKVPCNLAFLLYLADSLGYLAYAAVITSRTVLAGASPILPFFRTGLLAGSVVSVVAIAAAVIFFEQALRDRAMPAGSTIVPEPEAAA